LIGEGSMSKYDDYDYHVGDAVAKGRPEDNAFTHIGFMIAWLIGRGLCDPEAFGQDISAQVVAGSIQPNLLRDYCDGKLMSGMLTREGSRFLDAYYTSGYFADYQAEFESLPDYGVPDDREHQARIERRINRAYERWVKANRPAPGDPGALWEPVMPPQADIEKAIASVPMVWEYYGPEELLGKMPLPEGVQIVRAEPKRSHVDPALEATVAAAVGTLMDIESLPSHKWGSATLRRVLRDLGLGRSDAITVRAMGKTAEPTVEVHRLRGVDRERIVGAFSRYFENRAGGKWMDGTVGDLPARWGTRTYAEPSTLVWFALDGFVAFLVSTAPSDVVSATALRLLEALRS
jgi:hypothetical protein